ncbi:hypothetical protein MP213Fo_19240 [Pseudochrobactrum sp. MP213Fo]
MGISAVSVRPVRFFVYISIILPEFIKWSANGDLGLIVLCKNNNFTYKLLFNIVNFLCGAVSCLELDRVYTDRHYGKAADLGCKPHETVGFACCGA